MVGGLCSHLPSLGDSFATEVFCPALDCRPGFRAVVTSQGRTLAEANILGIGFPGLCLRDHMGENLQSVDSCQ